MKYNRIGIIKRLILAESFEKAKKLLKPLADKNNSEAQLILGYLYYGGDTITTAESARFWLRKSAKNGNPEAMALIARTDFKKGITFSYIVSLKSFNLLKKAALKGSAEAQRILACSYAHGDTVPKDIYQTMYWDEMAARQGLPESQHDLALMLLYGESGKAEIEKAIYWFEQCANYDHNVPYAEWSAESLSRIFSGEPDKRFLDDQKSGYWENRAKYLANVKIRPHPDWFYK